MTTSCESVITFQNHLASIMDVLLKNAVGEITRLFESSLAEMRSVSKPPRLMEMGASELKHQQLNETADAEFCVSSGSNKTEFEAWEENLCAGTIDVFGHLVAHDSGNATKTSSATTEKQGGDSRSEDRDSDQRWNCDVWRDGDDPDSDATMNTHPVEVKLESPELDSCCSACGKMPVSAGSLCDACTTFRHQGAQISPQMSSVLQPDHLINGMYSDKHEDDNSDPEVILESQEIPSVKDDSDVDAEVTLETQDDSSSSRLVCAHCGKQFTSKMGLKLHLRQHSKDYPFNCNMCDRGFHTKMRLQEHLARHLKAPFAVCKICHRVLSSQDGVRAHNALHAPPKHECKDCGKTYHTQSALMKHTAAHHEEKSEECVVCCKPFHPQQIWRHVREVHGERDKKCELCDFQTSRKMDLVRHMKTHGHTKDEICPSCGKSFKYNSSLKRHEKNCKGISSVFENMAVIDTSHCM